MKKNQGLIKMIVVIVIALIILGYYGFDVRRAIESPTTQSNFNYVQQVAWNVWNTYLKGIVTYIWQHVFLALINNSSTLK